MKIKIGIVILLVVTSTMMLGQYDYWRDQGILIINDTLVYFNLLDYVYNEIRLNPKEWGKNLVDAGSLKYIKNGMIIIYPEDKYFFTMRDAKYDNNKMWGDEVMPYDEHQFTVYFRFIDATRTEVSKDNITWEPLLVEFRSYDNLWPTGMDFLPYLHNDYKCTLYFKCSFFEGLYDAFTYPEEPG